MAASMSALASWRSASSSRECSGSLPRAHHWSLSPHRKWRPKTSREQRAHWPRFGTPRCRSLRIRHQRRAGRGDAAATRSCVRNVLVWGEPDGDSLRECNIALPCLPADSKQCNILPSHFPIILSADFPSSVTERLRKQKRTDQQKLDISARVGSESLRRQAIEYRVSHETISRVARGASSCQRLR